MSTATSSTISSHNRPPQDAQLQKTSTSPPQRRAERQSDNPAPRITGDDPLLGDEFWPWLIIQVTVTSISGTCGVWLFYVQHQFEDAYWERSEDWDYTAAAMQGSSFYKLPKILQWFSGNIGFHHIHHLSPRIPNYNLERCHRSDPMFTEIEPMSLRSSLKSLSFRLWDEKAKKLISFRRMKKQTREGQDDDPKDHESGGPGCA